MKYVQKHFEKENLCALQVSCVVLISQPVCACTRAQLRGNIGYQSKYSAEHPILWALLGT